MKPNSKKSEPVPQATATVIEVKDLTKSFVAGQYVLNGISFSVRRGEFLAVIGLSGSGKSTLLRCLNRLIEPTSGEIEVLDTDVRALSKPALRTYRQRIGMVFQQFNLIHRHTVLSNVLSGECGRTPTWRSLLGLFTPEQKRRALENLKIVGLAEKAYTRADRLSGGQKQRVAIARSLMQNPEILLADEPVASLDPATSHSVMEHLRWANKERGMTILCSLHFLSLVRTYADRVIALKGGKIVFEGLAHEIDEKKFKEIYGEDAREVEIR